MDRRREKRYAIEDRDIERGIERMEHEILAIMRNKTMKTAGTWGSGLKSSTSKTYHNISDPLEKVG